MPGEEPSRKASRVIRMIPRTLWGAVFVLLAGAGPAGAAIIVSGEIEGFDGDAPAFADLHLLPLDGQYRDELRSETLARNGRFSLSLDPGRLYELRVTAAGHEPVTIPLAGLDDGEKVSVSVTLEPLRYLETIDRVALIGDWQRFDFEHAVPMDKRPDGTWSVEVEAIADTLAYEVLGIIEGSRAVNGTQADYYAYDGGGDYCSVIKTKPGPVTISLDPRSFPRVKQTDLPRIIFDSQHRGMEDVRVALSAIKRHDEALGDAVRAQVGDAHVIGEDFRFEGSGADSTLRRVEETSPEPFARELAAAGLIAMAFMPGAGELDSDAIARHARKISPESPVWGMGRFQSLIYRVGTLGTEEQTGRLNGILEKNPDHHAQAMALVALLETADKQGNDAGVRKAYARLEADYADLRPEFEFAFTEYDPDRAIQPGKQVPDFEMSLLGSDDKITAASYRGKYCLLDFWATWCGPCIGEMGNLQAAWEKYAPRGLAMISVSLDRKPEDIETFRHQQWAMPWQHAFIEGQFQSPIAKTFEVIGIPKAILVGPDGKIIAVGSALRGEKLDETLAMHVGK